MTFHYHTPSLPQIDESFPNIDAGSDNQEKRSLRLNLEDDRSRHNFCKCILIWCVCLLWLGMQVLRPPQLLHRGVVNDLSTMQAIRSGFRHSASSIPVDDNASRTHLAIGPSQPQSNLCRTLFSALANGYDAPHLIESAETSSSKEDASLNQHYNDYLSSSNVTNDSPVLLINNQETWFQLPEVVARHRLMQMNTNLVVGTHTKSQRRDRGISTKKAIIPSDDKINHPSWLDAGTLYGSQGSLQQLFSVASGPREGNTTEEDASEEDRLAKLLVQDGQPIDFTVDVSSQLLQAMTLSNGRIAWETNAGLDFSLLAFWEDSYPSYDTDVMSDLLELGLLAPTRYHHASFWYMRPLARSTISNRIPAILSANDSTESLKQWWENMWFAQDGTRDELIRTFNSDIGPGQAGAWKGREWHSFHDLCGKEAIF